MAGLPLCDALRGASTPTRPTGASTPRPSPAPSCGPTARAWSAPASATGTGNGAVAEARRLLGAGAIVAVKGLGGYHLACDAGDEPAVATLRKRKDRGDKPFAVMVADLATAELIAEVTDAERALLDRSAAARACCCARAGPGPRWRRPSRRAAPSSA